MPTPERRNRIRFPLRTELRYQVVRRGQGKPVRGTGEAVNMSSKGLAFRSDTPLDRGVRLSVSMAWPALLDRKCTLRLTIEGTVLRCENSIVVLTIESHEFRTSGRIHEGVRAEIATVERSIETFAPAAR